MAAKIVELICAACGCTFERRLAEHRRNLKKGRDFFCSRKCSGKVLIKNIGDKRNMDTSHLRKGSECDELSPFRYYAKKTRERNKKKGLSGLSSMYIRDVWDGQEGACAISGAEMILPPNVGWWQDKSRDMNPWVASLDRIDSSLPYQEGNVQFVCFMANMCKNRFSDADVVEFCRIVTENHRSKS